MIERWLASSHTLFLSFFLAFKFGNQFDFFFMCARLSYATQLPIEVKRSTELTSQLSIEVCLLLNLDSRMIRHSAGHCVWHSISHDTNHLDLKLIRRNSIWNSHNSSSSCQTEPDNIYFLFCSTLERYMKSPEIIDFNHKSMKNETNFFLSLAFLPNSPINFTFDWASLQSSHVDRGRTWKKNEPSLARSKLD